MILIHCRGVYINPKKIAAISQEGSRVTIWSSHSAQIWSFDNCNLEDIVSHIRAQFVQCSLILAHDLLKGKELQKWMDEQDADKR